MASELGAPAPSARMFFSVLCSSATGPQSGRRADLKDIVVSKVYKGGGRSGDFLEDFQYSWYRQGMGEGRICVLGGAGVCVWGHWPAPA